MKDSDLYGSWRADISEALSFASSENALSKSSLVCCSSDILFKEQ